MTGRGVYFHSEEDSLGHSSQHKAFQRSFPPFIPLSLRCMQWMWFGQILRCPQGIFKASILLSEYKVFGFFLMALITLATALSIFLLCLSFQRTSFLAKLQIFKLSSCSDFCFRFSLEPWLKSVTNTHSTARNLCCLEISYANRLALHLYVFTTGHDFWAAVIWQRQSHQVV